MASAASFVGTANAATFSMTGKAAIGSGVALDLPAIGNVACPSITGRFGLPSMALPGYYSFPVTKLPKGPHNAAGCIPGGPGTVNVNGTGGFTIPSKFFLQQLPGGTMGGTLMNLNVTPVPNVPNLLQLATSFLFSGPVDNAITSMHTFGPWFEKKNPVIKTKAYAAWRVMKKSAWKTQTGRAGKTFTACGGTAANLACTKPSQGAIPAIIKNFGGVNGFGGTIGLVLTTSPTQASSVAIKLSPMAGGGDRFQHPDGDGLARGRPRLRGVRHRQAPGR